MTSLEQLSQELLEEKKYGQLLEQLCAVDAIKLLPEELSCLRGWLDQIPEEIVTKSPAGCLLAQYLYLQVDDFEGARRWYTQLTALRDACKEGSRERAILSQYVCCAGMVQPKVDNARLLLLLAILFNEYRERQKMPMPMLLTIVGGRPSVLRGAKDLSEWGKNYRAVVSIVGPMLAGIFHEKNSNLERAAVAELLYEYNDLNAASVEVAAALSSSIPAVTYAGMAQVARISRAGSVDEKRISGLLADMERLIEESGSTYLEPSYRALCVRFDIHAGRLEPVKQWLEECGVDELQCTLSQSYILLTKAQALIALGQPREAITLLERLILVLSEDFRPLDTIECLAHSAVAFELLGDREMALDKLEEALRMAEPYRYIRVIADRGPLMLRLLSQLYRENGRIEDLSEKYRRNLLEASRSYSQLRPTLYVSAEPETEAPELTPMELQILHLLEEGKTNREIGDTLEIKVPTVKFHLTNLFEKLGTKNRTAAISAAKKMGLLSEI